jgi:hypothetical protein
MTGRNSAVSSPSVRSQKVVSRAVDSGREDIGTGPLGVVGNLVGLVLAGWWLALGHLVTELILDHRHSFCLTGLYASFGPDLDLPGVAANLAVLHQAAFHVGLQEEFNGFTQ